MWLSAVPTFCVRLPWLGAEQGGGFKKLEMPLMEFESADGVQCLPCILGPKSQKCLSVLPKVISDISGMLQCVFMVGKVFVVAEVCFVLLDVSKF